jgi:predicted histidine transporter YuiF (NhaC family)
VVALLAGVNWILSPEEPLRWLPAMLWLPVLWLGTTLWYRSVRRGRHASGTEDEPAIRRYFHSVLTLAVVAVGIRQIVALGLEIWVSVGHHGRDLEFERRVLGLATSAVLVFMGNALPKVLTPLAVLPLHLAERVSVARRFLGTTLVVLGLGLATTFVLLPVGSARAVGHWVATAACLAFVGTIVWMNAGPTRRTS